MNSNIAANYQHHAAPLGRIDCMYRPSVLSHHEEVVGSLVLAPDIAHQLLAPDDSTPDMDKSLDVVSIFSHFPRRTTCRTRIAFNLISCMQRTMAFNRPRFLGRRGILAPAGSWILEVYFENKFRIMRTQPAGQCTC
jgi:hypothetical protein